MSQSKAMFILGGPGSGKDYVINNILKRYDLVEVQMDQILNGAAKALVERKVGLLINGNADTDKITLVKSILEGYEFSHTIVSVTNKVSRERNATRDRPLNEQTRIRKWLDAEKISLPNTFMFGNSLNLSEATQKELEDFKNQIEAYLGFLEDNKISEVLEWGTDETVRTFKEATPGESPVTLRPKLTMKGFRNRGVKGMPPNAQSYRVGGVDLAMTGSTGYAGGLVSHYEPKGSVISEKEHKVRLEYGHQPGDSATYTLKAKTAKAAIAAAIKKHRVNHPYHSEDMLKINAYHEGEK